MKVYHVETKKDCKALMIELEVKGCKWRSGKKPTHFDVFKAKGKHTYIYDEYGVLSFSDREYFKKGHSDETLIKYKAKGETWKWHKKKWNDTF